jgi:hypothetical protein
VYRVVVFPPVVTSAQAGLSLVSVAVDVEGVAGGDPGLGDGLGQVAVVVGQGEVASCRVGCVGGGQGGLSSERVVAVLPCSCVAGGGPVGAVIGRGPGCGGSCAGGAVGAVPPASSRIRRGRVPVGGSIYGVGLGRRSTVTAKGASSRQGRRSQVAKRCSSSKPAAAVCVSKSARA